MSRTFPPFCFRHHPTTSLLHEGGETPYFNPPHFYVLEWDSVLFSSSTQEPSLYTDLVDDNPVACFSSCRKPTWFTDSSKWDWSHLDFKPLESGRVFASLISNLISRIGGLEHYKSLSTTLIFFSPEGRLEPLMFGSATQYANH